MQIVPDGQAPEFPAGTVAIMVVRHQGECQPPHGNDSLALAKRIFSFFVDYRGKNIWEVGAVSGFGSFRLVKGMDDFGPEEKLNVDPARYKVYPCSQYD
jgi:hypothetical protein